MKKGSPYAALSAAPLAQLMVAAGLWVPNDLGDLGIVLVTVIEVMLTFAITWSIVRHFGYESAKLVALLFSAIGTVVVYALIYGKSDLVVYGSLRAAGFLEAVYFSLVTFTTLGYGDISPSESLRLVCASEAVLGYFYLGMLVGAVANFRSTDEV